jgi:hypothetical protein
MMLLCSGGLGSYGMIADVWAVVHLLVLLPCIPVSELVPNLRDPLTTL